MHSSLIISQVNLIQSKCETRLPLKSYFSTMLTFIDNSIYFYWDIVYPVFHILQPD